MNPDSSGSLEKQVGELLWRVRRLEEALWRQGVLSKEFLQQTPAVGASLAQVVAPVVATAGGAEQKSNAPVRGAVPAPATSLPEKPLTMPVAAPVFSSYAANGKTDDRSLENRIGSQWFNRIGILAMLIAAAWFLKLAMDNHWIGPLGRVLIGLVAGAALIAWSERFRSRGFAGFSYSLKAVGSGTLYLSLWAAFSLYQLMPSGAAFPAMIVVTAFNGLMAWRQDAELLALYAIAGGLSTPLLISTGENHEIALLSYLLLLDLAVLVLVALKPWSRLLFVSFVGTALLFGAWASAYYTNDQLGRTTFFLSCFFLCFAFAPRLVRVDLEDGAAHSAWDNLALVLLPVANAALGFIAYYSMYSWMKSGWVGAWLAVGFASFYLLLNSLPAQSKLRASTPLLSAMHLTAAVVFLTIAIPLKAQGHWLTIGWLVEGGALMWVAARLGRKLLRALALGCLALGFLALVANSDASTTPFFNARFGCYCVGIAVFAFAAWIASTENRGETGAQGSWPAIAAGCVLTVNALILIAVGWEIHSYWWVRSWTVDATKWQQYQMNAQFTYSAWFMVFGAALLAAGFWRRSAFLRWQALLLLAVTIGKVFLLDMSQLSQGFRILSFLGLGALLLAVSFVYQRDWLKLRAGSADHEA